MRGMPNATTVDIQRPDRGAAIPFRIEDNGIGMTPGEFEVRWRTLDYDRVLHQGLLVQPPPGLTGLPRPVYGRATAKDDWPHFCSRRLTGSGHGETERRRRT
jgi:hypothetical protein